MGWRLSFSFGQVPTTWLCTAVHVLAGWEFDLCIKASPQQPAPPPSPSSESGDRGIFKNIYYIRNHCFQRSSSNNSTSNICCSCFLSHNVLFLSGKASCVRFFADGSRSTCEQRLFPDFLCLLLSSKRKHRDGPRPKRSPTFLTSPLYKMLYSSGFYRLGLRRTHELGPGPRPPLVLLTFLFPLRPLVNKCFPRIWLALGIF